MDTKEDTNKIPGHNPFFSPLFPPVCTNPYFRYHKSIYKQLEYMENSSSYIPKMEHIVNRVPISPISDAELSYSSLTSDDEEDNEMIITDRMIHSSYIEKPMKKSEEEWIFVKR